MFLLGGKIKNSWGGKHDKLFEEIPNHTVDGLEIRRSPVDVGSSSQYLQGFIPGGARFLPSTVWFHSHCMDDLKENPTRQSLMSLD